MPRTGVWAYCHRRTQYFISLFPGAKQMTIWCAAGTEVRVAVCVSPLFPSFDMASTAVRATLKCCWRRGWKKKMLPRCNSVRIAGLLLARRHYQYLISLTFCFRRKLNMYFFIAFLYCLFILSFRLVGLGGHLRLLKSPIFKDSSEACVTFRSSYLSYDEYIAVVLLANEQHLFVSRLLVCCCCC